MVSSATPDNGCQHGRIAVQGNSGDIVLPPRTNLATSPWIPTAPCALQRPIDALKMAHFRMSGQKIREAPPLQRTVDMPPSPAPDAQMLIKRWK
jgi:hypothetical protein